MQIFRNLLLSMIKGRHLVPRVGNGRQVYEVSSNHLLTILLREASNAKKSQNCGLFPYGGGGSQPHSIAFGGVFPNIIEAILVDEISTK